MKSKTDESKENNSVEEWDKAIKKIPLEIHKFKVVAYKVERETDPMSYKEVLITLESYKKTFPHLLCKIEETKGGT